MGKAMPSLHPFSPEGTISLAASTTTGRAALAGGGNNVRVFNAGTATVFIKRGTSTIEATTSDMPVPAGAVEIIVKGAATHIAGITASGTATIYFTVGDGV